MARPDEPERSAGEDDAVNPSSATPGDPGRADAGVGGADAPSRTDASDGPPASEPPPSEPARGGTGVGDLFLSIVLVLVAPAAFLLVPSGSLLRAVVVLPALLVVPGYLLLQAVEPRRRALGRVRHAGLSLGLSFPLVGLAVLVVAATPWGMRPIPIVAAVTAANLGLAAAAVGRRRRARPASGAA